MESTKFVNGSSCFFSDLICIGRIAYSQGPALVLPDSSGCGAGLFHSSNKNISSFNKTKMFNESLYQKILMSSLLFGPLRDTDHFPPSSP